MPGTANRMIHHRLEFDRTRILFVSVYENLETDIVVAVNHTASRSAVNLELRRARLHRKNLRVRKFRLLTAVRNYVVFIAGKKKERSRGQKKTKNNI